MEEKHTSVSIKSAAFCCAVFAIILYLNTLSAEFAYDDNRAILRNSDVLQETPLINIFYNDFWGTPLTHSGSHKSYRPLCVLTFRFNHAIHGLQPFGYHLVNVLCHGLVTFLYTIVVGRIVGNSFVATLSGILFACHPIHTEAVAGIVGRADLLASVFYLGALLCYLDNRMTQNSQSSLQEAGDQSVSNKLHWDVRSAMCLLGVGLCSAASMLCKEHGLTVLLICSVFDVFIRKQLQPMSLFSFSQLRELGSLRELLILCFMAVLLISLRLFLMGGEAPEFAPADNPASESDSFLTRTLTFCYLPCVNFNLMLCPILLSFDWSMDAIPLIRSFSDPRNLVSLLFYSTLSFLVIYTLWFLNVPKNHSRKIEHHKCLTGKSSLGFSTPLLNRSFWKDRTSNLQCFCMALALIIIPFLPATNLLFYTGFVVAERILYIPSMGFCLLVAQGFCSLLDKVRNLSCSRSLPWFLWMVFLLTVVLFSCRTVRRNMDWQTEESLYRSGLRTNPAKALGNLGNILKAKGKMKEAELAYRSALAYRSNMADVHYNLGLYYQENKRYNEAIESYIRAIECRPKLTVAYLNLGLVYNAVGLKSEAEKLFQQCYEVDISGLKDPRLHEETKTSALYNLGRLLADDSRLTEAVEAYKKSFEIAPVDYPTHSIHNMLGEAYFRMEVFPEAERQYRQSLALKPDHVPAYLTLAKLFQAKKQLNESEDWLLRALQISPKDVSIYRQYGQLLIDAGRSVESVEWLLKAVAMEPDDFETNFNCANALRQANQLAEAEEFYRRAVRLKPTEVVAHMNLGAILHFNGKLKEAEGVYLDALKMKPNDVIIQANLKKLYKLMAQSSAGV